VICPVLVVALRLDRRFPERRAEPGAEETAATSGKVAAVERGVINIDSQSAIVQIFASI